jgi:hypothetical protein
MLTCKAACARKRSKCFATVFNCLQGLREKLFVKLKPDGYLKFSDSISQQRRTKKLFDESEEIKKAHAQYTKPLTNGGSCNCP